MATVPPIYFSWYDYSLFVIMLLLSALIGIYFGCFGKKQSTANEYLLGGKTMRVFPISMSLIASTISGIAILAIPTDIYFFGACYWLILIPLACCGVVTAYVYLPVFYKLQITSTYEYLELRFDRKIRLFSSFLYTLKIIFYLPIVIYIPALAFSQATGFPVHLITIISCLVCIFYTTIGGLKAVVWTDTLQFSAMIGAIAALIVVGTKEAGGVSEVFRINIEGKRFDFDTDISPFKKETVWTLIFGGFFMKLSYLATNQGSVQKFLALGEYNKSKKAVLISIIGLGCIYTTSVLTGILLYAKYYVCDPFTSGQITKRDQLLPHYILEIAGDIPGLSGLFIAGLFSASLSTLSATMNSLSGTIYEDFISPFMKKDITQKTVSNILKILVVLIGVTCTGFVFIVEKMGGLFPLTVSFGGAVTGPMLGLFTLGMLCPIANAKGALVGGIFSLTIQFWMIFGAQYYKLNKKIINVVKPLSTENCTFSFNETLYASRVVYETAGEDSIFFLYKVSIYYYCAIGTITLVVVGCLVGWITSEEKDYKVNKDLISPVVYWLIDDKKEYLSVDKALCNITESERDATDKTIIKS